MQRDQGPQKDHDPEVQGEDARQTRLNRIPIRDSERNPNDADRPDEAPAADHRFGEADDERRNEGHAGPGYGEGYGSTGGSTGRATVAPGAMSPGDEKTWSMLAHLSVLISLVTGIGGFVAALVIWLVYKDRSPRVGFHALQSLWYQVAWAAIIIGYSIVSFILTFVVIGVFMFFLLPIIGLIPIVHQCYAAYKVSQGVDYRYPIIADMIDGNRRFG